MKSSGKWGAEGIFSEGPFARVACHRQKKKGVSLTRIPCFNGPA